jgi:hypothetical protein
MPKLSLSWDPSPAASSGDAAQDFRVEKREDYHDLRLAPHHHWEEQGQLL